MDNNIEVLPECYVEWDRDRGVLYVHNRHTGTTVVRVCGLRKKVTGSLKPYGHMIDITRPERVSYPEEED